MEISIVSPCYGAPTLLKLLVEQITEAVVPLTDSYEILLVEDYIRFLWKCIPLENNSNYCPRNDHII